MPVLSWIAHGYLYITTAEQSECQETEGLQNSELLPFAPLQKMLVIPDLGQSLCIVGLLNLTPHLKPPKGIYCPHLKMGHFTV